MRHRDLAVVGVGVLVALAACSSPAAPSESTPSSSEPVASSEEGNVGMCHSLSIELMTVDAIASGYADGSLDRPSFNYMATSIAAGFPLLGILHPDATLGAQVESVRSAIAALATADAEPGTGDASPLGQARSALAAACDSAGAPLSIYQ